MKRKKRTKKRQHPFRRAVLRGLGVVLPPLLTIVILLWIGNSVQQYVLEPIEALSRHTLAWYMDETLKEIPAGAEILSGNPAEGTERKLLYDGHEFVQLANGSWIPAYIRDTVLEDPGPNALETGSAFYHRYVQVIYLKRAIVIPFFLAGFVLVLYLLGKFLAAGVGRILWTSMEHIITRLPIIRTVYSSVKQVTDFFLSDSEIEFTRVVAVEYPRKGMWSLGFVTGESMFSIREAAGEPVISVLMPTSPIPGTGFTITVRKSEAVDLDIAVEEALQFVVSCGVVVPEGESSELTEEISAAIEESRRTRVDDVIVAPPPTTTIPHVEEVVPD